MPIYHVCPNPSCKHENWSDFEGAPQSQSCCPYISISPTQRAVLADEEWPVWALDLPRWSIGQGSGLGESEILWQGIQFSGSGVGRAVGQVEGRGAFGQFAGQVVGQGRRFGHASRQVVEQGPSTSTSTFGRSSGLAVGTQTLSYQQWREENIGEVVEEGEQQAEGRAEDEEEVEGEEEDAEVGEEQQIEEEAEAEDMICSADPLTAEQLSREHEGDDEEVMICVSQNSSLFLLFSLGSLDKIESSSVTGHFD